MRLGAAVTCGKTVRIRYTLFCVTVSCRCEFFCYFRLMFDTSADILFVGVNRFEKRF